MIVNVATLTPSTVGEKVAVKLQMLNTARLEQSLVCENDALFVPPMLILPTSNCALPVLAIANSTCVDAPTWVLANVKVGGATTILGSG